MDDADRRPSGPSSGVRACDQGRGDHRRPWAALAAPGIRPQAERFARACGRAALWALNDADRPGWRPPAAIEGARRVLVRVAAIRGGGTAVAPGQRWRPLGSFGQRLSGSPGRAGGQLCGL